MSLSMIADKSCAIFLIICIVEVHDKKFSIFLFRKPKNALQFNPKVSLQKGQLRNVCSML